MSIEAAGCYALGSVGDVFVRLRETDRQIRIEVADRASLVELGIGYSRNSGFVIPSFDTKFLNAVSFDRNCPMAGDSACAIRVKFGNPVGTLLIYRDLKGTPSFRWKQLPDRWTPLRASSWDSQAASNWDAEVWQNALPSPPDPPDDRCEPVECQEGQTGVEDSQPISSSCIQVEIRGEDGELIGTEPGLSITRDRTRWHCRNGCRVETTSTAIEIEYPYPACAPPPPPPPDEEGNGGGSGDENGGGN